MEEEVEDIVPCTSLVVDSLLRVRTVGAIWGLCAGPHKARKRGLTGIAQASHVAKAVTKYSFQCVSMHLDFFCWCLISQLSLESVGKSISSVCYICTCISHCRAANPLVFGDYPITKKKNVGSRLPIFSNRESKLVKGSFDFLGIVHYFTIYIKDNSGSLKQKLRDFNADMAKTCMFFTCHWSQPN
ncbi:hypothetical protein LWI28_011876 [Acer negundo]|uniref:Uncharacterized protein n=1 Tax=Acer negundo TaxID=4023 RepID=A0AAD5IYP0_ACENE|nr:hypothetical protein LWI28_011876 [Acer negundo]